MEVAFVTATTHHSTPSVLVTLGARARTLGFQSWNAPVGLAFQAQACSA
jgi:hypothetical protein